MRTVAAACILFAGAATAVDVYLHPASAQAFASASGATPDAASVVISQHLGLEFADPLLDDNHLFVNEVVGAKSFVGQGQEDSLLLTINEDDARDVIPTSLKHAFELATPPMDSLSSLISTYLHRAGQAFTRIYSSSSTGADLPVPRMLDVLSTSAKADVLLNELATIVAFLEEPEPASGTGKFAALELTGLKPLADAYGRSSEQYTVAASTVKATLESALARENTRVALLTFTPTASDKRADADQRQPPAQSPLPAPGPGTSIPRLPSTGQCFTTADACSNATSACSGRGACAATSRAGRQCFVCACATTKNAKNATLRWAGVGCERKDISQDFVLLVGTSIALIVLIGGSIALIAGIGSAELPSILTGASGGKMH